MALPPTLLRRSTKDSTPTTDLLPTPLLLFTLASTPMMALPPILLPPSTLASMLMTALPPTRSTLFTLGSTPMMVWPPTPPTPSTTLMGARGSKADSQAPTNLFYLFHGIQSRGPICIEIDLKRR